MATLFVKHVVSDYDNWKRVYDDFASVRKEKGVTGASVHRDPEDPNTLVVTHQFKDVDAAAAFRGLRGVEVGYGECRRDRSTGDLDLRGHRTNPVLAA